MNSLIVWFLSKTKVGKAVTAVQEFLDGKKQLLTGLAGALPATLMMVQGFQAGGLEYLSHAAKSPEYAAALIGWGLVWNAVKGEKIRAENQQIIEGMKTPVNPEPTAQPTQPAS